MSCAALSQLCLQPCARSGAPRLRSRSVCTTAIADRGARGNTGDGGKGVGNFAVPPVLALDPQTHLISALCSPEAAAAACVVRFLETLARTGQPGPPQRGGWGGAGSGGSGSSRSASSAGSAPLPLVWQAVSTSLFLTGLSAASEHGFTSAQQRQIAADVLPQLEACLAAHEVSPAAAAAAASPLPRCWPCACLALQCILRT